MVRSGEGKERKRERDEEKVKTARERKLNWCVFSSIFRIYSSFFPFLPLSHCLLPLSPSLYSFLSLFLSFSLSLPLHPSLPPPLSLSLSPSFPLSRSFLGRRGCVSLIPCITCARIRWKRERGEIKREEGERRKEREGEKRDKGAREKVSGTNFISLFHSLFPLFLSFSLFLPLSLSLSLFLFFFLSPPRSSE